MKILQVIYGLYAGGAERFVVDLSNELSKNPDNKVIILVFKSEKDKNSTFYKHELSENIKYETLGYLKLNPTIFFRLYKYINTNKPDVVHIHSVAQYAILPVLFYRKCKYIETIHNQVELIPKKFGLVSKLIDQLLYRNSNYKSVAISDANCKSFVDYFGFNCSNLIYNGRTEPIKSDRFNEVSNYIDNIRPTKNSTVICHIARCCKQKNQPLLFSSFERILQKGADVILLVIGGEFNEYKSKGYRNVFFLGTQHNVADYLYNSDAFCLSSLWEGMPITLIEAFACSCIPLGTPVSGFADLVENGVNGFVAKDFTENSFVEMLEDSIAKKDIIILSKLRELYDNKLSIEKCSSEYYQIYK